MTKWFTCTASHTYKNVHFLAFRLWPVHHLPCHILSTLYFNTQPRVSSNLLFVFASSQLTYSMSKVCYLVCQCLCFHVCSNHDPTFLHKIITLLPWIRSGIMVSMLSCWQHFAAVLTRMSRKLGSEEWLKSGLTAHGTKI